MQFRLISDIHLDFDLKNRRKGSHPTSALYEPVALENDNDTVLVIAGDLWVRHKFLNVMYPDGQSWLSRIAQRFKAVVFVLGNHDFWQTRLDEEGLRVELMIKEQRIANAHFLRAGKKVVIDGVKFVGDTLWTDFKKHDPLVMMNAALQMNDYRYTRFGPSYRKMRATDVYDAHINQRNYIFKEIEEVVPTVVVTHMAPSFQSIDGKFRTKNGDAYNFYYYSSLESELIYNDRSHVQYWCHGHIHNACDYLIGDTRVITNPRGYLNENKEFDDTQIFVVKTP